MNTRLQAVLPRPEASLLVCVRCALCYGIDCARLLGVVGLMRSAPGDEAGKQSIFVLSARGLA